ncbi:GNAT family N-acetyltransferase [Cellulomonas sp. zg-ZUI222]|uniref:GNAT family N-acetyltransferase n=1 Tax=Cellulomonas wangleii TaxID=2816956 RepID=A0ABX8D7K0_9CELL|nr:MULTISPECIES: GNAT family protein [Cellulomonas]MBO0901048.1 GNAT family N-acetyltransferase [Cellulomonas sp. zg-ZUI22]MBO0921705.1 GNAT family N-acetyltransferase [Cellulomonas wangleii]MBO0925196.1 GNAT family N-acetyltransferase [Cellulomonas wangleii]QVI63404.1 GNAT family N-acetyltransferase [Cellulomonas wangleii]
MQKPTLQGEMIVLRPIGTDDADAMWDMLDDAEGKRLTGTTRGFTREEVDAWCASREAAEGRYDFAVTAFGDDEYRGEIVLTDVDPDVRCASLRLSMRPLYRGRGYGTEAIELVLGFAFDGLDLHRVELEALSINTRAVSLYENIGFRREGRRRDAYRDGAGWCDAVVMSMLEDEYRAGRVAS